MSVQGAMKVAPDQRTTHFTFTIFHACQSTHVFYEPLEYIHPPFLGSIVDGREAGSGVGRIGQGKGGDPKDLHRLCKRSLESVKVSIGAKGMQLIVVDRLWLRWGRTRVYAV